MGSERSRKVEISRRRCHLVWPCRLHFVLLYLQAKGQSSLTSMPRKSLNNNFLVPQLLYSIKGRRGRLRDDDVVLTVELRIYRTLPLTPHDSLSLNFEFLLQTSLFEGASMNFDVGRSPGPSRACLSQPVVLQ